VGLVITIQADGRPPERCRLDGAVTAGGSQADQIVARGLPPCALRLEPRPAGVVLTPAVPGLRVAGHAVSPGGRRLLRTGEQAALHGVSLRLVAGEPFDSTRTAAAALLRDAAGAHVAAGPHLVVLTGPDAGRLLPVGPEEVIGRGRGATLCLEDPEVSRRHARLRLGPDRATIEDLGAKNGVRVNGVRMDPSTGSGRPGRAYPIGPGDEITLGDTTLALSAPPPARARGRRAASPRTLPGKSPVRHRRRGRGSLLAAALLALSAAALVAAGS